jgi:FlaA1/EpsC-like NDP-sugar epimerase
MNRDKTSVEQKPELRYGDTLEQLSLWYDRDQTGSSRSVTHLSRKGGGFGGAGNIALGMAANRWLLLFGDAFLVALAGFLSTWVRFGMPINIAREYTIAWTITIVLFPPILYVFDLYNPERTFRSWDIAYRSGLAVVFVSILAVSIFFLAPFGAYGRGIMFIQVFLAWVFLNGWRWLYGVYSQKAAPKIPVVIVGAGSCGRALYQLLKSPLSPYEIKGFVDDDPTKTGKCL